MFTHFSCSHIQAAEDGKQKCRHKVISHFFLKNLCVEGNNYGCHITDYPTKSLPQGRLTSTVTAHATADCCGHLGFHLLQHALQLNT